MTLNANVTLSVFKSVRKHFGVTHDIAKYIFCFYMKLRKNIQANIFWLYFIIVC